MKVLLPELKPTKLFTDFAFHALIVERLNHQRVLGSVKDETFVGHKTDKGRGKKIVTIIVDSGLKYLHGDLYK